MNDPINVMQLITMLSIFGKAESPKRKASLTDLLLILIKFPNETMTFEEVDKSEEMTARHKTWIRQIVLFKLV